MCDIFQERNPDIKWDLPVYVNHGLVHSNFSFLQKSLISEVKTNFETRSILFYIRLLLFLLPTDISQIFIPHGLHVSANCNKNINWSVNPVFALSWHIPGGEKKGGNKIYKDSQFHEAETTQKSVVPYESIFLEVYPCYTTHFTLFNLFFISTSPIKITFNTGLSNQPT